MYIYIYIDTLQIDLGSERVPAVGIDLRQWKQLLAAGISFADIVLSASHFRLVYAIPPQGRRAQEGMNSKGNIIDI